MGRGVKKKAWKHLAITSRNYGMHRSVHCHVMSCLSCSYSCTAPSSSTEGPEQSSDVTADPIAQMLYFATNVRYSFYFHSFIKPLRCAKAGKQTKCFLNSKLEMKVAFHYFTFPLLIAFHYYYFHKTPLIFELLRGCSS